MTSTRAVHQHRFQLLAAVFAALATALALTATADAATFCLADPVCPAGGIPMPTPEAALTAANADANLDTVRIGPGTYNTTALSAGTPAEIIGAGRDATKIVETDDGFALWMSTFSSVRKLAVHLTQPKSHGVELAGGADATDVEVTAIRSATAGPSRAGRGGTAGANRMTLRRRLGARRLAPGRYRLTLVARDAAANKSNAVRAKFTVKR